jgi:hypothetical protein
MELPCPHESDLFYRPALLEAWKRGEQVEYWADEYPVLFDADNRRNARGHCGRGYHFGEWFTAITLYHRYDLRSVVGKYTFRSHAAKTKIFERLVTDQALRDFLRGRVNEKLLKRPDLLVYPPDYSSYCFIEVKRADTPTQEQQAHFGEISRRTGAPWGLIHLRKCTEQGCAQICFTCTGPAHPTAR